MFLLISSKNADKLVAPNSLVGGKVRSEWFDVEYCDSVLSDDASKASIFEIFEELKNMGGSGNSKSKDMFVLQLRIYVFDQRLIYRMYVAYFYFTSIPFEVWRLSETSPRAPFEDDGPQIEAAATYSPSLFRQKSLPTYLVFYEDAKTPLLQYRQIVRPFTES